MNRLFWLWGSAFLLGVFLGTTTTLFIGKALVFLTLAVILITIQFLSLRRVGEVALAAIFLFVAYWHGYTELTFYEDLPDTKEVTGTFRVVAVTEEVSFYNKIVLEQKSIFEGKIIWQAPVYEFPRPGEQYTLSCTLERPENFSTDFNYRRYLAKEGVSYLCKRATTVTKEPNDTRATLYDILYAPRFWLEDTLQKLYPNPESALAAGLLLGGSNRLPSVAEEQFQRLGLTHIVAVSGYNIVIIINTFLLIGIWCGLNRKKAILVSLIGIFFFVVMIGAPASAVRAGLMTGAALGSFFIGRPSYSFRALFLAVLVMVTWNPLVLLYDAGFQLSFLATIGVLFSLSLGKNVFSEQPLRRFFQETLWLSFFVYLFLLPILLYHFQQFTPLSILANSVFLPLVPIAMLFSFLGAVAMSIFPSLGLLAGWLGYMPLTIILRGTEYLSQIPWSSIPFQLSLPLVLLWYGGTLSFLFCYEQKKLKKQYEKNFTCHHIHEH